MKWNELMPWTHKDKDKDKADKDLAGFSLASLKETSWLAKWEVRKVTWKDSLIHKPILN